MIDTPRRLAALAVGAMVLAGCGSTARLTGSGASNGVGGNANSTGLSQQGNSGSGQPGATGTLAGGSPSGVGGVGNGGGGTGPGVPGSSASGGGTGVSSSGAAIPLKGKGWDAEHVYLGVATESDATKALGAAGIAGDLNFGDAQQLVNAVLADINKHGGILGRQVVPIYQDTSTSADENTSAQATCVYFTQDHQVIGVVNMTLVLSAITFNACMVKARTPVFSSQSRPVDNVQERQEAPFIYSTLVANYSRVTPLWVKRLDALRYFTGWDTTLGQPGPAPVKIGLLHEQNATATRIFTRLTAQLTAAGHPVTSDVSYDDVNNANGASQLANAVVAFRQARVTHVISDRGNTLLLFMPPAESQHYRPRYAMNSYHTPSTLLAANDPQQMNGTVGIGWEPGLDVAAAEDPGSLGAAQTNCMKVMKDAGVDVSTRSKALGAWLVCDEIRLPLQASAVGNGFDYLSMHAGIGSLGAGYQTAGTFGSGLSPSRYALPGFARDFAWDSTCGTSGCIRYLSKVDYPIGG